ncbi:hypothetical protein [Pedobacter aquatilis]|uniref:hypothetical protein n=1 Tax=Pedobacter aquatilis TaxID=351343 RepID=UPI00292D20D1|nr:hypothetical protein [Pedobacter aquatilis]
MIAKFLRFLVYCLLAVLAAEIIRHDALSTHVDNRFSEDSFTEHMQSVLLVISAGISIFIFKKDSYYRMVALLFFTLLACSFFREQDIYFERYLGKTTWMYPVCLILMWFVYHLIRNFRRLVFELRNFVNSYSFGIFLTGFLTTFIFSRLFGRKIFWYAVMDERYFRAVKNAAEECLELFGYLMLLIATIELLLESRKRAGLGQRPNPKMPDYLVDWDRKSA